MIEKWLKAINENIMECGLFILVFGILITINTCTTGLKIDTTNQILLRLEKMEARDADK